MLVEPADLQLAVALQDAGGLGQGPGDQLGEGRFALAVDAEQTDTVVDVEPEGEVLQDRAVAVAGAGAVQPHDRRGEGAFWRGQVEPLHMVVGHGRDRRQLGQALDPALGLGGLGGLGLEAVDE